MNTQDDTPTSMNPCDALRDLLPAYAWGVVDPEEARQMEALLAACPDWQAELAAYEQLSDEIAALLPPVTPPPSVKAGLMQAVANRARPRRAAWGWVAAACLLVALVVSNAGWALLSSRQAPLELVLPAAQAEVAPDAIGRILWTRAERQAVLVLAGLPPLAPDQTYQAWMRDGEHIVSLGLVQPQPDGSAALLFDGTVLAGHFDTVGVTIEPAGGSPSPTTPPIVHWQGSQSTSTAPR